MLRVAKMVVDGGMIVLDVEIPWARFHLLEMDTKQFMSTNIFHLHDQPQTPGRCLIDQINPS